MTVYEDLKHKQENAIRMALQNDDENLKKFYINAAIGFQKRINRLSIEEAKRNV